MRKGQRLHLCRRARRAERGRLLASCALQVCSNCGELWKNTLPGASRLVYHRAKMKSRSPLFLQLLLLACLSPLAARATTTLDLQPLSGSVSGPPGSTVGWGFTLTNTSNYLLLT